MPRLTLVDRGDGAERDVVQRPVPGAQPDGADRQSLHRAGHAAQRDPVADLHRVLQQQEQPGDEVLHQLLRAEAPAPRRRCSPRPTRARVLMPSWLSAVSPTTARITTSSDVRRIGSSVRSRAACARCASRVSSAMRRSIRMFSPSQHSVATTVSSAMMTRADRSCVPIWLVCSQASRFTPQTFSSSSSAVSRMTPVTTWRSSGWVLMRPQFQPRIAGGQARRHPHPVVHAAQQQDRYQPRAEHHRGAFCTWNAQTTHNARSSASTT